MKANKYMQLLSLATSVKATVEFQETQIADLKSKTHTICRETTQALGNINDTLSMLALSPPPLTHQQLETLHSVQRVLEQQTKNLHKSLEKPMADYSNQIAKQELTLDEKIIKVLNAEAEPCAFDLDKIRQIVKSIHPKLAQCKQQVAESSLEIGLCQAKTCELQSSIEQMDLPRHMQQTAKSIQKLIDELAHLNLQLGATPEIRAQYRVEFLPLSKALIGLRLQSSSLLSDYVGNDSKPDEEISSSAPKFNF